MDKQKIKQVRKKIAEIKDILVDEEDKVIPTRINRSLVQLEDAIIQELKDTLLNEYENAGQ